MAVLDGKVLKPQIQDIIYLGLKWDELEKALGQGWGWWGPPVGFAAESLH